jgi:hypothetical protein
MLNLTIDQLVQIAANGGGFEIDAARVTKEEIIRILRNGAKARFVIKNSHQILINDLVQIAANSGGNVFFE